jgi:hypothetical protein
MPVSKRPSIDLMSLTSALAEPMPEAVQRSATVQPRPDMEHQAKEPIRLRTEELVSLGFKVAPAFRKRFRQRAAMAELSHLELLFAALDAWEEKQGLR